LRSLARQAAEAERARASAAQAHDLALLRYRGGVGNFLEALTARQQLIAAEQRLVAIEARRGSTWAALNAALGGGFVAAADAPSLAASPYPESARP
jgi:outer membrane protein TolC